MERALSKKNPVPKVISLVELYKSYLELTLTIGISVLFIFIHFEQTIVPSTLTVFVDLSLVPWLVWLTKKLMDTIKSYKLRIKDSETKYEAELLALETKRAAIVTQRGGIDLLPNPQIENSLENGSFDEGAGLIL
jgi:hypothetical protein